MNKKQTERLIVLILLTVNLFVFIGCLFLPGVNRSVWPIILGWGLMVVCFWVAFIVGLRRNKSRSASENDPKSTARSPVGFPDGSRTGGTNGHKRQNPPNPAPNTCARCGIGLHLLNENKIFEIDGKKYCDVCTEYFKTIPKYSCALCKRAFPSSEMTLINGNWFCRGCKSQYQTACDIEEEHTPVSSDPDDDFKIRAREPESRQERQSPVNVKTPQKPERKEPLHDSGCDSPKLLFRWEMRSSDPYETDGVYYEYLSSEQKLFSTVFHDVAAGCGHGGTGGRTLTNWNALYYDAASHPGVWNEETWKLACADNERYRFPFFDNLKKLRSGKEKQKGHTATSGRDAT